MRLCAAVRCGPVPVRSRRKSCRSSARTRVVRASTISRRGRVATCPAFSITHLAAAPPQGQMCRPLHRARLMRPIGMRGAGRGKEALRSRQGEAAPNCRIAEYSALNCRFDACSDQRFSPAGRRRNRSSVTTSRERSHRKATRRCRTPGWSSRAAKLRSQSQDLATSLTWVQCCAVAAPASERREPDISDLGQTAWHCVTRQPEHIVHAVAGVSSQPDRNSYG